METSKQILLDRAQGLRANVTKLTKNLTLIQKWEWDYTEALDFQYAAWKFVLNSPNERVYIICNHPPVLTMGHGLQKSRGKTLPHLQESPEMAELLKLGLPVHPIKRGGGLTFHHPGQWILYAICALNTDWKLSQHFDWLLSSVAKTLDPLPVNVDAPSAGLWFQGQKLASVGLGVEKFVTLHGLALNVHKSAIIADKLAAAHPCGLSFKTYTNLEEILKSTAPSVEEFHRSYIKTFQ